MSKYQTILAVCETHSISKAASKLNYTQSAVSQTIKNFEKELGVPLFKRSKQGMEQPDLPAWKRAISASGQSRAFPITGCRTSCGTFPKVIPISGSN